MTCQVEESRVDQKQINYAAFLVVGCSLRGAGAGMKRDSDSCCGHGLQHPTSACSLGMEQPDSFQTTWEACMAQQESFLTQDSHGGPLDCSIWLLDEGLD